MLNSSITDMVFIVGRDTTAKEVNELLEEASKPGGPLAETAEHGAILGFETKPLVSTDYCGDTRSTIVDAEVCAASRDRRLAAAGWCWMLLAVVIAADCDARVGCF